MDRDRRASGGISETGGKTRRSVPLDWHERLAHCPARERQTLLVLAREQGFLFGYQLPSANGVSTPLPANLARILEDDNIEQVCAPPLPITDESLDEAQRDAVAKALATPDVCLIQGLPGTGKSRVVTEVVTQAASRGERVLLVAPSHSAVDRILEAIGERSAINAVRVMGANFPRDRLPVGIRNMLCQEKLESLADHALRHARETLAEISRRLNKLTSQHAAAERMEPVARNYETICARIGSLDEQRERIEDEVRREAEGVAGDHSLFSRQWMESATRHEEQVGKIDATIAEVSRRYSDIDQRLGELEPQINAVRQLVEAKAAGRWWTWNWWRALLHGGLCQQFRQLEAESDNLLAQRQQLQQRQEQLAVERERIQQAFSEEKQKALATEIERRQHQVDSLLAELQAEKKVLEEQWREAAQECCVDEAISQSFVETLRTDLANRIATEQQWERFTREWIECFESDEVKKQLLDSVNVVGSTVADLGSDGHFGHASGRTFDLLIVQEADQVETNELLKLAARAKRSLLIGEPACCHTERFAATDEPQPSFFHQLWQKLHCDPRQNRYSWLIEPDGRLCCRLRPVDDSQRSLLECENVADRPDIELRIFADPQSEPVLAEVVFPTSMSIAEAKEYIFKELEELPIFTTAAAIRWSESPEAYVLQLQSPATTATCVAQLASGVREIVGRETALTYCLEFDRQAGWTRQKAQEWIRTHLGWRDLGRTARLDVPHRMQPELASFLSELLFAGEYRVARTETQNGSRVEFVSISASRKKHGSSRSDRQSSGGLELELSDHRLRNRLPASIRSLLPRHGIVNYLEAKAIVDTLEQLVKEPEEGCIGVIALYEAQADLIRKLVEQSSVLQGSHRQIHIGVPAEFQQCECHLVLVSLTRSHTDRAVSYGDSPRMLSLALTRARSRLILFGDPATLVRRSQWQGPLDHLDETAALTERQLISHLVRYLEGAGPHQSLFQLRTGGAA
ncbi:MAG: hypothetical protein KatS3mg105_2977 [Gemmatales bacterium]|nr:MAG: hypothetical protein KatS3mg105_2977 [Gemmatales bacterium]